MPRALSHLERRERVDVHLRDRFLDRLQVLDVVVAGERMVDAALHADLGGPALPCLACALRDLLGRQQIGLAAEVQ